jgi:hypothetical protein
VAGEQRMGWYNQVTELAFCNGPADFNSFCEALMEALQKSFMEEGIEIAHLKILCSSGKEYCKEALTTTKGTIIYTGGINEKYKEARLNVNIRALVVPERLSALIEPVLEKMAAKEFVWETAKSRRLTALKKHPILM